MSTAILLRSLTKRYGDFTAVQELSLEVARGELFGFLGPNGAGKTTTIGMILGLLHPTSGRVDVFGRRVTPASPQPLAQVGALVGAPGFYPYLSGYENLHLLARFHGLPRARVDASLEQVSLRQAARRPVKTYSTGMKQRLGLAAALLHHPRLLILDEPTSGLDPIGMAEMRTLLRQLADDGMTIFLSSHLLHEVEQICDRIGILHHGRLVALGSVSHLRQEHRDLERVFLDAIQPPSPTAMLSGQFSSPDYMPAWAQNHPA